MSRRAIMWNPERMNELRLAAERADNARQKSFRVEITDQGTHEFTVADAHDIVLWLREEFARNPPQARQPYNEGEEGQ